MPAQPIGNRFHALVVEDDGDDAALIHAAFTYRSFDCGLRLTRSSEEAIDYLLGRWPYDDRLRSPLPDVIILDIGLPGMDGLQFLRWLNSRNEPWANTPVIVFTGSTDRAVSVAAFALGAREVRLKPDDFHELVGLVESLLQKWRPHIA